MISNTTSGDDKVDSSSYPLRTWMMVGLTAVFVALYAAALFGWLHPSANNEMVSRLEPIIFAIVGYYFGRTPSAQTESTLKDEIDRQVRQREAAAGEKDNALREKAEAEGRLTALEQKINGARAALSTAGSTVGPDAVSATAGKGATDVNEPQLWQVLAIARRVLDA